MKYSSDFFFSIYIFFSQKWIFFNKLIFYVLIDFFFSFSFFIYFFLEKGFLEKIGPFGTSEIIQKIMKNYSLLLKGLVYHYLGFILLGLFFSIHFFYFF